MKNLLKILLMLTAISLVAACSKSDDDPVMATKQLKSDQTGTVASKVLVEWDITFPVYCDGEVVDEMIRYYNPDDPLILPCLDHYKNGEWIWTSDHVSNVKFISKKTGNFFTAKGNLERWIIGKGYYWKFNLVGEKGQHYVCHLVFDDTTWEVIESGGNCH